jgi:hypothetical protein
VLKLVDTGKAESVATDTPSTYGKSGWLAAGDVNGEWLRSDMVDNVKRSVVICGYDGGSCM